jgi:ankyrin
MKMRILSRVGALAFCWTVVAAGCCHTHDPYRSIHQDAINGNLAGVEEDLKRNPKDVDLRDSAGQTPLHLAAIHCRTNVVALLIEKGGKIDATALGGATPLHLAAQAGCSDVVRMLLAKGAEVNQRDNDARTALDRAKQWHHDDTAELIREKGGVE